MMLGRFFTKRCYITYLDLTGGHFILNKIMRVFLKQVWGLMKKTNPENKIREDSERITKMIAPLFFFPHA